MLLVIHVVIMICTFDWRLAHPVVSQQLVVSLNQIKKISSDVVSFLPSCSFWHVEVDAVWIQSVLCWCLFRKNPRGPFQTLQSSFASWAKSRQCCLLKSRGSGQQLVASFKHFLPLAKYSLDAVWHQRWYSTDSVAYAKYFPKVRGNLQKLKSLLLQWVSEFERETHHLIFD